MGVFKKNKPVVFLFILIPRHSSKHLKTKVLTTIMAVKKSSLAATGKNRTGLELPSNPVAELSGRCWKAPFPGLIFLYDLVHPHIGSYSQGTIKGTQQQLWQIITVPLPQLMLAGWAIKRLTKNLKGKTGNEMITGGLKGDKGGKRSDC